MCGEVVFVLSVQYYYVTGRIDLFYSSRYAQKGAHMKRMNPCYTNFPRKFL